MTVLRTALWVATPPCATTAHGSAKELGAIQRCAGRPQLRRRDGSRVATAHRRRNFRASRGDALVESAFGKWRSKSPARAQAPKHTTASPTRARAHRDRPTRRDRSDGGVGGLAPGLGRRTGRASSFVSLMGTSAEAASRRRLAMSEGSPWAAIVAHDLHRCVDDFVGRPFQNAHVGVSGSPNSSRASVTPRSRGGARARAGRADIRPLAGHFATVEGASDVLAWRAIAAYRDASGRDQPTASTRFTPADIHASPQRAFATDAGQVRVAGDWSTLQSRSSSLGWGPIEIHDATGALVRIESPHRKLAAALNTRARASRLVHLQRLVALHRLRRCRRAPCPPRRVAPTLDAAAVRPSSRSSPFVDLRLRAAAPTPRLGSCFSASSNFPRSPLRRRQLELRAPWSSRFDFGPRVHVARYRRRIAGHRRARHHFLYSLQISVGRIPEPQAHARSGRLAVPPALSNAAGFTRTRTQALRDACPPNTAPSGMRQRSALPHSGFTPSAPRSCTPGAGHTSTSASLATVDCRRCHLVRQRPRISRGSLK